MAKSDEFSPNSPMGAVGQMFYKLPLDKIYGKVYNIGMNTFNDIVKTNPWIISDTHFGHRNIKVLANRPNDWQERLLDNIFTMIKPNEFLIHLGDFSLCNAKATENFFRLITEHCRLVLFLGNHDSVTQAKLDKFGVELVIPKNEVAWVKKELSFITLSHSEGVPDVPFDVILENPNISHIHLHGHVHEKDTDIFNAQLVRFNLSVERTNFKPLRLFSVIRHANDIMEVMRKNPLTNPEMLV